MRLTKTQQSILGKGYQSDVLHTKYSHLHPRADEDAYFSDEEEQSYAQFVDMGNRPPNEEGTGRFTITPSRNRIACLFFVDRKKEKSNTNQKKQRERIREFLEIFLHVPVDIIEYDAKLLSIEDETIHIGDYIYELDMYPKLKKGTKKRKKENSSERAIEVFSLFDALEGIVTEPYLSMVAFIDSPLCEVMEKEEGSNEEEYSIVYGRACGNRIACVSLVDCVTFKDLLCVTLHELLHTVGFDHCNSWRCLMNATGSDSWIFLSPVNLRKLKVFHDIDDSNTSFLLERYEKLRQLLVLWQDSQFNRELTWLEEKLRIMKEL